MAAERDGHRRQAGADEKTGQEEIARAVQDGRAVSEKKGGKDVERALLGHPRQRRQDDLPRLAPQHLQHRRARDLLPVEDALKHGRFEKAQPNVEPDPDHDDRQPERHPPSPFEELIARNRAEDQHENVGEEEPGRTTPLRPGGDKAAMLVGPRPFHRHQGRAAPLAADADALDKAHDGQDDRAPDTDLGIARDKADREGRQARQQEGGDQRRLAADAVAVMAEKRRSDRARDKADRVNAKGLQGSDQRVGVREIQFGEDERRDEDVEQKIIRLDNGADRAGDDGAAQLGAVLGFGKTAGGLIGCRHPLLPLFVVLSRRPVRPPGTVSAA